tara:strand:- start:12952 stop:13422 length:471 start_codon:yes stop_codon:yes gene_type:complete
VHSSGEINFILVTKDGESFDGCKVSALDVIKRRIERNSWPIYEKTRGRKLFTKGSKIAFYIGGMSKASGKIIATAKIENIVLNSSYSMTDDYLIEEPAYLFLNFSNVQWLEVPIKVKEKISKLSFCPQNMSKWGVVLMGGCRTLDNKDWFSLFSNS